MGVTNTLKQKPMKQVTRLMSATMQCSELSAAYGSCMVKNYQNMNKDACLKEFMAYKRCVMQHLGRSF